MGGNKVGLTEAESVTGLMMIMRCSTSHSPPLRFSGFNFFIFY